MGISPEGCHVNAKGDEMVAHGRPQGAARDDIGRLANRHAHLGAVPALAAIRATVAGTALRSGLRPRALLRAGWAMR